MKRLILFAGLILATTLSSLAQPVQWKNPSNSTGIPDTVSNATAITLVTRNANKGTMAVQLDIKKVSGTVAGVVYFETSIDKDYGPVQWGRIPGADTLLLTDGDNTKVWKIAADYLHYRIRIAPTGTQKHTAKAFHLLKQ